MISGTMLGAYISAWRAICMPRFRAHSSMLHRLALADASAYISGNPELSLEVTIDRLADLGHFLTCFATSKGLDLSMSCVVYI